MNKLKPLKPEPPGGYKSFSAHIPEKQYDETPWVGGRVGDGRIGNRPT